MPRLSEFERIRVQFAEVYPDLGAKETARVFGITYDRCRKLASLWNVHINKVWTAADYKWIRENHKRRSISQMAEHFGTTYRKMYSRVRYILKDEYSIKRQQRDDVVLEKPQYHPPC